MESVEGVATYAGALIAVMVWETRAQYRLGLVRGATASALPRLPEALWTQRRGDSFRQIRSPVRLLLPRP